MVLRCLIRWEMGLAARKTAKKLMSCVILCSLFFYTPISSMLQRQAYLFCVKLEYPGQFVLNFGSGVFLRVVFRWQMGLATRKPAKSTWVAKCSVVISLLVLIPSMLWTLIFLFLPLTNFSFDLAHSTPIQRGFSLEFDWRGEHSYFSGRYWTRILKKLYGLYNCTRSYRLLIAMAD